MRTRRSTDRPGPLPLGSTHHNDYGFMLKTAGTLGEWVQVDTFDFWPVAMLREHGTTQVWETDNEVAP